MYQYIPLILFSSLLSLALSTFAEQTAESGASAVVGASYTNDAIAKCLAERRREAWEKPKQTPSTQEPKSENYKFKKSKYPLPSQCLKGDLGAIKRALTEQVNACAKKKKGRDLILGCQKFSHQVWCSEANQKMLKLANSAKDFRDFFQRMESQFDWYKSEGALVGGSTIRQGEFQITKYDTPIVDAVRERKEGDGYNYPIYSRPPDLVEYPKVKEGEIQKNCGKDPLKGYALRFCRKAVDGKMVPYYNREEIDSQRVLNNKEKYGDLVIAWVKSPLDAYDAMMQGSVVLDLKERDGSKKLVQLNYAGQNGGINYMLGQTLKCANVPKEKTLSMSAIRKYIEESSFGPIQWLNYDKSYVFFREAGSKPIGSQGTPLEAGVSMATDPKVIPTGSVAWYDHYRRSISNGKRECDKGRSSLGIAQDVGGRITGAHFDEYDGIRKDLEGMNDPGSLFIAIPKGAVSKVAAGESCE